MCLSMAPVGTVHHERLSIRGVLKVRDPPEGVPSFEARGGRSPPSGGGGYFVSLKLAAYVIPSASFTCS